LQFLRQSIHTPYIYIYIYRHIYIYIYIYIYTNMRATSTNCNLCVCLCVCMYIYIYTHTRTRTYTHTLTHICVQFLRQIESGQLDNPYHSATHVADVVQSIHCLIVRGGMQRFVGRLELLAALLAACIHDFEHRGFNNDFLIKTQVCMCAFVCLCVVSMCVYLGRL
jgi:hypothetical protein